MEALSKELVTKLVLDWVKEKPQISRAWLYGSRIRGKNWRGDDITPESDWDVAVELAGTAERTPEGAWFDMMDVWRTELNEVTGLAREDTWKGIGLELYHAPKEGSVVSGVNECGELIYQRF